MAERKQKPAKTATRTTKYVITSPHADEALSRPFESMEAAKRALETVRQLHPDAYIARLEGR